MNTAIDIRHVLPAIRVPTLILHRTGDLDIDVGGARYMAERIPRATYVELPGNDHLVFAGDQEAVLGEIEQFLTGVRPATEPDSVLATILLTEIIGAVAIAARLGAGGWAEALGAHERMVRDEIARFRGQEVSSTASGIVAIFDGPARAVRCAASIVERARGAGIDVRAGLHTGECEVMDGEIRGIAARIAAEVLMQAERGTVVVSSTIPDLLAGSGITFHLLDQSVATGTGRILRLYQVLTTRTPGEAIGQSSKPTERGSLTPRELEVARLIALGQSNREVAEALFISVATVERHVANIFTKLDLRSRTQLGVWIAEHGLIAPDQA
jgi:DNA-binding CsgD family transcriptional regulator